MIGKEGYERIRKKLKKGKKDIIVEGEGEY